MRSLLFVPLVFFMSCDNVDPIGENIPISGESDSTIDYLTIGEDTIRVKDGIFIDTLMRTSSQYDYIQASTWKWPKIIYLDSSQPINLNIGDLWISTGDDKFNEYLLNKDSLLIPYTARWNMIEKDFRQSWESEFPINMKRIKNYFQNSKIPIEMVEELIQMEYMQRGHRTANFISFQEKREAKIDRSIYEFVDSMDLSNKRLEFHVNNRNFQYYYYLDRVPSELDDSIYPFAAIDTVTKYVKLEEIRNMIITGIVRSGLYDETVNHDALFEAYEENVVTLSEEGQIMELYEHIQKLKPGKVAPAFGSLVDSKNDTLSLDSLRGKNILISAWGTWCPFCKEELPHLKKLIARYPHKLESVAISLDEDSDKWKNHIKDNDWGGIHLIDPVRNSSFKENYLISGTNRYFLIDKSGIIIVSTLKPSDTKLDSLILGLN